MRVRARIDLEDEDGNTFSVSDLLEAETLDELRKKLDAFYDTFRMRLTYKVWGVK